MKPRTRLGLIGSAVWVAVIGFLLLWKHADLAELTLADWGSFIAGASSGLALLWLVLGYLQQGEELHQNTTALELQAHELHALVHQEQTRSRRDAVEARPRFVRQGGGTGDGTYFKFRNEGAPVHDLSAISAVPVKLEPTAFVGSSAAARLQFVDAVPTFPYQLRIQFHDRLGGQDSVTIELRENFDLVVIGFASDDPSEAPPA